MSTLQPYLTFDGNCEEAFRFYKSVFGGDFSHVGRFKDMPPEHKCAEGEEEKIMHISLPVDKDSLLMGSDTPKSYGQSFVQGNNFSISINAESEAQADKLFKGLSEGGKVMMPMQKTFWGAYFGMFTDKFGIHWMINFDYNQNK